MVFNLHGQFERLREEGRYQRMREKILERDRELAGDINPMLDEHGKSSAARHWGDPNPATGTESTGLGMRIGSMSAGRVARNHSSHSRWKEML